MTLQIDRATVKKAVIDYASRNLLGDAKMYDIDNAKTVITKSGMVEISINLKDDAQKTFDLDDIQTGADNR